MTNPEIELEDPTPIDLVTLSPMHDDHFDRLVQEKLDKDLPIVTNHQAVKSLKQWGFRSLYPLDT